MDLFDTTQIEETSSSSHNTESGHGEDACGHEAKLFTAYATYNFNTESFTIMVIVVIVAVLGIEFMFKCLHHFTHDSPFNKMITRIEKELMSVGFTAFLFKIIINSSDLLKNEWLHAFELAGIFFNTLSFQFDSQLISSNQTS
jgi:predicted tellurium resistance membrane protein TerC